MAIPQDVTTGSVGVIASITSVLGYIQPALGILVALVTLVAVSYSIRIKRKQLRDPDDADKKG